MSTTTITHRQAHGLRTGEATATYWQHGVESATRHNSQPSLITPGRTQMSSREYALDMANAAWGEGDARMAAYWSGYAAAVVRLTPVAGMTVLAAPSS